MTLAKLWPYLAPRSFGFGVEGVLSPGYPAKQKASFLSKYDSKGFGTPVEIIISAKYWDSR